MKNYTDLKQSKQLAEILPIESADMCYQHFVPDLLPEGYCVSANKVEYETDIPCWSLAALLSVLPFQLIASNQRYGFGMVKGSDKNGETYAIKYATLYTIDYLHLTAYYNNPIDACVEMVEKLHELKLLRLWK